MQPKEIYRSLVRLHILVAASRGPIDSTAVARNLDDRGFALNLASVRHILRGFESKGYLVSTKSPNGRVHDTYAITRAGRLRVQDATQKVAKLIEMLGRTSR